MDFDLKALVGGELTDRLPETPHELPYNRARVDEVRGGAQQALAERLETVLGTLQIATRTEVEKLERKLALLNKKVRELEKGSAA